MPLPKYAPLPFLLMAAAGVHAESNKIAAQYWIDVSTTSMSIPGMSDQGGMLGSMIGSKIGSAFGGMQGKTVNTELWVRAKPAGTEGEHAIPDAMNMGSSLKLLPIKPVQVPQGSSEPSERSESTPEKPKGRILIYWGCGEEVKKGQPKIIDFSSPNYNEFATLFATHGRPNRGVQSKTGDSVWPNEKDRKPVPDNASLLGSHAVSGEGVPSTLKFDVGAEYDFLPKVRLSARGDPKSGDSIQMSWNDMENAKGYFLQSMGSAKTADGGSDMILWSSSESPDAGWAMMTYLPPAQVAKLQQQKTVLSADTTSCAIPKGIFAKAEGAMVNMIAYGPEFNASYPARPQKAPADWQPDWTARIRIKSTGMTMLGMAGGRGGEDHASNRRNDEDEPQQQPQQQPKSGLGGLPLPAAGTILKGLFGR